MQYIKDYLSDNEVNDETISAITNMLAEKKTEVPQSALSDDEIRVRMYDEEDWKRRASLAALLISRGI